MEYELKISKEEMIDTFIQFFVIILSGYRDFLNDSVLDRQGFINSQPPEMQPVRYFLFCFSSEKIKFF